MATIEKIKDILVNAKAGQYITVKCNSISSDVKADVIQLSPDGNKHIDAEKWEKGWPKTVPTASDYVQDGLIMLLDGNENAGWGTHDPEATTWKDLIGGTILSSVGTGNSFNDISFVGNGYGGWKFTLPDNIKELYSTIDKEMTFEICVKNLNVSTEEQPTKGFEIVKFAKYHRGTTYSLPSFNIYVGYNRWRDTGLGASGGDWFSGFPFNGTVTECGSLSNNDFYYAASKIRTNSRSTAITEISDDGFICVSWILYDSAWRYAYPKCDICSFRVYNRKLSEAEISANYAIDKRRFNLS